MVSSSANFTNLNAVRVGTFSGRKKEDKLCFGDEGERAPAPARVKEISKFLLYILNCEKLLFKVVQKYHLRGEF